MRLNPFQSDRKKRQRVLIISICLVLLVAGVVLYRTFALFQESKDYNVIKGSVPDYIDNYDVKVALTIDGVGNNKIPGRNDGKAIESITCDKGAKGIWDYVNWALNVDDLTTTRTRCQVNFVTRYTEPILYGTDPVLKDGMIPVMISDEGVVTKASEGWEWYDYETQKWANIVILNDETKEYYDGDVIPEEEIESYFVWIPRHSYEIFDVGNYPDQTTATNNAKPIVIHFENNSVAASNGTTVGSKLTHPAFTAFDVNGLWIGKFETGYKGANSTADAQTNTNVNDSTKVQIKPNVYSWRNINVANAYLASYNYKRELESHMMKNTEWGAVAYLQHSIYGSAVDMSKSSVRINNNSAYLTGYAAKNEPTCGYTAINEDCNKYESTAKGADGTYTVNYFNSLSVSASTTNNYSGVYAITHEKL